MPELELALRIAAEALGLAASAPADDVTVEASPAEVVDETRPGEPAGPEYRPNVDEMPIVEKAPVEKQEQREPVLSEADRARIAAEVDEMLANIEA